MSNLPGFLESKKIDILKYKTHLLSRLTFWDGFLFFTCCSKSVYGLTFFFKLNTIEPQNDFSRKI